MGVNDHIIIDNEENITSRAGKTPVESARFALP
jgi:hypothetical protein